MKIENYSTLIRLINAECSKQTDSREGRIAQMGLREIPNVATRYSIAVTDYIMNHYRKVVNHVIRKQLVTQNDINKAVQAMAAGKKQKGKPED